MCVPLYNNRIHFTVPLGKKGLLDLAGGSGGLSGPSSETVLQIPKRKNESIKTTALGGFISTL